MLGLGRMGANRVRRLMNDGHECVVFDQNTDAVKQLAGNGAATPAPVLTAALFSRFSSRDEAGFDEKLLSAMRFQFGGHHEKSSDQS